MNTAKTYQRLWKCSKCDYEVWLTYEELAEVGIPICPEDGDDCELVDGQVRYE